MTELMKILDCLHRYDGVVITNQEQIERLIERNEQSKTPIEYFPTWMARARKQGVNFYRHSTNFQSVELVKRLESLGSNQDYILAILENLRPMPAQLKQI